MELIPEKLDDINNTLKEQNEIIKQIVETMNKKENPFVRFLIIIGLCVSALGIIEIINNIRNFGG